MYFTDTTVLFEIIKTNSKMHCSCPLSDMDFKIYVTVYTYQYVIAYMYLDIQQDKLTPTLRPKVSKIHVDKKPIGIEASI